MSISLDLISAVIGLIVTILIGYHRFTRKKKFPFPDMITVFFLGVLLPVAVYYVVSILFNYYPEFYGYVYANPFNPVYQALIGLVLIRYFADFVMAEIK